MSNISTKIKQVLDSYFHLLDSKLPNILDSYYIYGSISLGAFTDGLSDIDFIAVLKKKLIATDIATLKMVHKDIQKKYPKMNLDGIYVIGEDFEYLKFEDTCPVFRDGELQGFSKFNKDSIDAFQLKKYGIVIKGQELDTLNYTVDWRALLIEMHENLNTYWANWKRGCEKFPSNRFLGLFFSLRLIEWGVLGVSRLYYTFMERDIISKKGAGEFALKTVPARWHKIIKESMRLRDRNPKSFYTSKIARRNDALQYIDFIIQESNKLFSQDNRC
jgi:hypothetical protein